MHPNNLNTGFGIPYLFDFSQKKFIYVSDNIFHRLGYLPIHFYDGGMDFLLSLIHPEDYSMVLGYFANLCEKLSHKKSQGKNPWVLHKKYRIKSSENEWYWINEVALLSFFKDKHQWEMLGTWNIEEVPLQARSVANLHRATLQKIPENLAELIKLSEFHNLNPAFRVLSVYQMTYT